MSATSISSLETVPFCQPFDAIPIVQDGVTKKAYLNQIADGMVVASDTNPGIMSASAHAQGTTSAAKIAILEDATSVAITAAETVTIPSYPLNKKVLLLTGSTPITAFTGGDIGYHEYLLVSASGTVTVLGQPLVAGEEPMLLVTNRQS